MAKVFKTVNGYIQVEPVSEQIQEVEEESDWIFPPKAAKPQQELADCKFRLVKVLFQPEGTLAGKQVLVENWQLESYESKSGTIYFIKSNYIVGYFDDEAD